MRLYVLHKKDNIDTYFIISGSYEDFLTFFRSIENRKELKQSTIIDDTIKDPSGFYTKWFSFNKQEETIIDIKAENEEDYREIYDNFYKEYEIKNDVDFDKQLPDTITTKCIDVSPLSNESPLPYLTAIWEIC